MCYKLFQYFPVLVVIGSRNYFNSFVASLYKFERHNLKLIDHDNFPPSIVSL